MYSEKSLIGNFLALTIFKVLDLFPRTLYTGSQSVGAIFPVAWLAPIVPGWTRKLLCVNKVLRWRVSILPGLAIVGLLAGLFVLYEGRLVLFGGNKSLLLSQQQIALDQQLPAFGVQFPAQSLANTFPTLFWWFGVTLLGLLAFPLVFAALRGLADRGYIFSKTLGMLLLAYLAWVLACLHALAFSHLSTLLVVGLLLLASSVTLYLQRRDMLAFVREHWRLLLIEEALFTLAFLLFVGIRSLDPDLWNIYIGGEKPMELAFLNAILRSPYMPPLDPWFAGGYINYYYYGYVMIGSLIKLTGIVPTTAFNLAIPTLFALTFTGALSIVYSLTRRLPFALLGGYFAALIGNFDGFAQLKEQVQAALAHLPVPMFSYWRSSRVIPFTINEFPFWSFLFADLHPHVMNMPVAIFMLAIVVVLLMGNANILLYILATFVFGTLVTINPWDMPVYALLLGVALLLSRLFSSNGQPIMSRITALLVTAIGFVGMFVLAYLLYWPFYASYQELYVNGLGFVTSGTNLADYLTINDLWIFLTLCFFLLELYRWWTRHLESSPRRVAGYLLLCAVVLTIVALLGLKMLLGMLIALGLFLFVTRQDAKTRPIYLLLMCALSISLGLELVYIRDFMDGSQYERMNSVFKFSIQAWFCFAIGGALAARHLWTRLSGFIRRAWQVGLLLLITANSVFLPLGTLSRIADHQAWTQQQPPPASANYLPALDGSAFIRAWYPGDAEAIAWINKHIAGSPVILEAAAPYSYSWFNRVSVYTGLPDVLGWPDHVGEQRPAEQVLNRLVDVGIMYTTTDTHLTLLLLHYYHVRYIYVGDLERQIYTQQTPAGLDKFDSMVGSALRIVYRFDGVTIYEVIA